MIRASFHDCAPRFSPVMRWRQDALQARSRNLYRGIWIGAVMALALIALMYFVPQLIFPRYCPPGFRRVPFRRKRLSAFRRAETDPNDHDNASDSQRRSAPARSPRNG